MLCQFSFGNYKAFKEEALLDLTAEAMKEHEESLIVDAADGERFLPVAALYGPNGGGKSTVLNALNFLRIYVLKPIIFMKLREEIEKYDFLIKEFSMDLKKKYHRFSPECENLPIWFDIMFRAGKRQYRYQLSIQHDVIVMENLYVQTIGEDVAVVFERTQEECVLGEEIEEIPVDKVSDTMPLIAHIAINYNIEVIDAAAKWFLKIDVVDYNNPRVENRIPVPKRDSDRKKMFEILQAVDIQISDVRVEKDIDGNIIRMFARHILGDGSVCEIPIEEESSGTRKLLTFLKDCISGLEKGTLIIADELDAKLHPKLLQYVIELFTNPETNRHGAQLILTSHDITTMNPRIFRRDEIWFCAKNPVGAAMLYSLSSFRKDNGLCIRNDEAYGKRYLEGKYGADPYIQRALKWEEEYEPEAEEGQ